MNAFRITHTVDRAAEIFGITREQLIGGGRTYDLTRARHVTALVLWELGCAYPAIGRRLGNRDRKTALQSVQQARNLIPRFPYLKEAYDQLTESTTMKKIKRTDEQFRCIENAQVALSKAMLVYLDGDAMAEPDWEALRLHVNAAITELSAVKI